MRGTKAKRIRRAVYGDQSIRNARVYVRNGTTIRNLSGSLRALYQTAKKEDGR